MPSGTSLDIFRQVYALLLEYSDRSWLGELCERLSHKASQAARRSRRDRQLDLVPRAERRHQNGHVDSEPRAERRIEFRSYGHHLATFTSKVTVLSPPAFLMTNLYFPSFAGVTITEHFGPGESSLPTSSLASS